MCTLVTLSLGPYFCEDQQKLGFLVRELERMPMGQGWLYSSWCCLWGRSYGDQPALQVSGVKEDH